MVFRQTVKTQQQQQQQQQHKKCKQNIPCRCRELNAGLLAPKADALQQHNRVNCEYRLSSSYF